MSSKPVFVAFDCWEISNALLHYNSSCTRIRPDVHYETRICRFWWVTACHEKMLKPHVMCNDTYGNISPQGLF